MKFWQKIYIFSLLLVILAISITGVILVQNLHNKLMEKEIEKSIAEEKLLAREIQMRDSYFENYMKIGGLKVNYSLDMTIRDYRSATPCEGKIQILDMSNQILFTDMDFPSVDKKEELENLAIDTTHLIIKELKGRKYVYICSLSRSDNKSIKVYYAKDITSIYEQREDYYMFFIKLGIWICFIFSIFMFFISRMMTSPIEKLIATTKKIASGNYTERAKINSKDEFGLLAYQFNQMAQTVEDKIIELENSNEEKEAFIHNLTHELKTPLTSIIGYADLIRTSKYNEKLFFESADYIYKEGKQLEQMAFKMMDLIYAKSQQLTLENIDVIELINEIGKTFKDKLENKQIDLSINIAKAQIIGDRILIKMLLSNIMDNAIKASDQDSYIYIIVTPLEEQTVISIQDEGVGIAKEHLNRICQPFYIVDPARTKKNNGAGIGLAICQKIVEAHEGKIEIESELGKGTKVSIILK